MAKKKTKPAMSAGEARERHEQMQRDNNFNRAYHQADHPNHREAVQTLGEVLKHRD